MNKFNAGDLSKKPSQVFESARNGGALIQHKDRSGKVVEEFVLIGEQAFQCMVDIIKKGDL